MDPMACIPTGRGPWNERIIHFLPDKEPSAAGNEIQSEYFVKYENYVDAVNALYKIKDTF
jgi:xylitol oxidase